MTSIQPTKREQAAFPTRELVLASMFSALIAVGAFIQIPIPFLSFSLQTLFLALAAVLLKPRWAVASVVIYIAVGLLGFPIFSRGGGIGYILQPSFGFLIGFVLWAWVSSTIISKLKQKTLWKVFAAETVGVVLMYAVALPYYDLIMRFYEASPMTAAALFTYCFATTFPGDILKSLLAAWMGIRIRKQLIVARGE